MTSVIRTKNFRPFPAERRRGLVLALALVVLVVLASAVAILSARVFSARHRQQYIIDYQQARYGMDSALKYMLAVMPGRQFTPIVRAGAPDFSDLFWMTRQEYDQYIANWAAQATPEQIEKYTRKAPAASLQPESQSGVADALQQLIRKMLDIQPPSADANEFAASDYGQQTVSFDPNQIEIPGPYGPRWPYVIEPIEIEIGSAKVRITIEDENAKMPLSWGAVAGKLADNRQAKASIDTFTEWMQMDKERADELVGQLDEIGKKKVFTPNPSPILLQAATSPAVPQQQQQQGRFVTRRSYRRPQQPPAPPPQSREQTLKERPAVVHATDFAKLFHSSLLDSESLSRPQPDRVFEDESCAKYLSLWGSQRVNINTAPRQVLEAAFTFGGRAEELAEKIIEARREKPFPTIAVLRDTFYGDLDAIGRVQNYIDTRSNFFSIHIESASGAARVWAVATVIKEREQMQLLAVMYGR